LSKSVEFLEEVVDVNGEELRVGQGAVIGKAGEENSTGHLPISVRSLVSSMECSKSLKSFLTSRRLFLVTCFFGLFLDGIPASRQILRMVLGARQRPSRILTCSAPSRLYLFLRAMTVDLVQGDVARGDQ